MGGANGFLAFYALCSRSMFIGAEMSRKDGPLVTKVALFWVSLFFGQLGYHRPADAQACEGLDRALGRSYRSRTASTASHPT
jgi:hypothetical protein